MRDFDLPSDGGPPFGGAGSLLTAGEAIDRVQALIDAPEPYDGYPLVWQVETYYLGDISAIAAASLRERAAGPAT